MPLSLGEALLGGRQTLEMMLLKALTRLATASDEYRQVMVEAGASGVVDMTREGDASLAGEGDAASSVVDMTREGDASLVGEGDAAVNHA